jgi:acyl-CoA thioester hydrolase
MATYFETYRSIVRADQCDHLGHMNVQYYAAAMNDGGSVLLARLGLTPEASVQRRIAAAVVHMETDYLREVREGDEIVLESALERVGGKSFTILHRLHVANDGAPAMETLVTAVLLHLDTRKAVALPDDVRSAALALAGALS